MASLLPRVAIVDAVDSSSWEWRAFAPQFEPLAVAWPPQFEATDDTYIVCPESETRAVISGGALAIDRLEERSGDLERWRGCFRARFPLCQREVRDALRQFPVELPTLTRPQYHPFEFAIEVAACTNGLRVIGVRCVRRDIAIADCILERTSISLAGTTMQTIAVKGSDPAAVRTLVRQLQLDRFDSSNMVEMIKGLLGVDHHAHTGANH